MTSSLPLTTYHQYSSSGDHPDSITAVPSKNTYLFEDGEYDPYAQATESHGRPWSDTAYSEPVAGDDGVHKPSLSYGSKELVSDVPTGFPSTSKNIDSGQRPLLSRWLDPGKYPLEQQIEAKKRGIPRQRYPVVVWALTATMIAVFIYELVVNAQAQGSPFSFHPVVNPMLGPSGSALIRVGARFPPCMKTVSEVPATLSMPCLNDTANPPDRLCTIEDLCGHGGFHGKEPDQWWRFITPIFLHAGVVHILLNMLAQVTAAAEIEREMGSVGFFVLYFATGIFGNVLGGNFSLVGVPSVGASGAIFGVLAVTWVDLFAHWRLIYKPGRRLFWMLFELIVGIGIGYIPYVDNFAHLGGFVMGLMVGTVLYPVISTSRRHKLIMSGFRLAALPLAVILYVLLVRNFYTSNPYAACSGCRYLSCIPRSANNYCKGTGITTINGASSSGTSV